MLPNLRVASPCSADWNRMQGDDRVRFCPECRLDVYDFSAMTAREIEQLLAIFYSSRRRHTISLRDWEFRRVLFRSSTESANSASEPLVWRPPVPPFRWSPD